MAILMVPARLWSQVDGDQLGAWYMLFWSKGFENSNWGLQGDLQYRSWNLGSDLEQIMLRAGVTYQPTDTDVKFTLGYAQIISGEFGDSKATSNEHRIYQEGLLPQKVGGRFLLTHRFRFEQRFVEGQDFRTRFRYNLFLNVPLNRKDLSPGAVYLAFYNELFINGQRGIGNGRSVEIFDRNRAYAAAGYSIAKGLRTQLGVMNQTTNSVSKPQLQLSLHYSF